MRLAIIGAGPIAGLSAAIAAGNGHQVALWPPRGAPRLGATRGGRLRYSCRGAVEAEIDVELLADADLLAGWEVLLLAIPADAYVTVLRPLIPRLGNARTVICGGALSLVPLWLAEGAARAGGAPDIIAWGTTLGTGRILPDRSLQVGTVRSRFEQAALPAGRGEAMLALSTSLFGDRFAAAPSLLVPLLSNINPVAHAGQVIPNLSRIDRAEAWQLFANFTQSGAAIAEAIDAERVAVAAAFGVSVRSLATHYHLSYHVPPGPVAALATAIEAGGRGPRGPATLAHRYLDEDVPFGLVVYEALGRLAAVPTPILSAAVTLLGCAAGKSFRAMNPILDELGIRHASMAALETRCGG